MINKTSRIVDLYLCLRVFSKRLDTLLYNKLISFVYELLTGEQLGFRDDKSTELASHTFIEYMQEALDNQAHVIGIFLDLTKAYDVLNLRILWDKLESYGTRSIFFFCLFVLSLSE